MQRIWAAFFLTLLPAVAIGQGRARADSSPGRPDIEITAILPVRGGASARLCPGGENEVRVVLSTRGLTVHTVPLRLSLVLPDGPPAGSLIAEGSASINSGQAGTFTFLHVDIPSRIRGRGAKLVVRANADQGIPEQNLANDVRQLDVDRSTDWSCRG